MLLDFGEGKGRLNVTVGQCEVDLPAILVSERQRREASATKLYFLRASEIRNCSMKRLPRLQELKRKHTNWIVMLPVDMTSSVLGDYAKNMLAISHRREHPEEPDTKGTQLVAIKGYLACHLEMEFVWLDFPCMPQKPRSPEDKAMFAEMFASVNVIYVGMRVLILLDISYMSRFWTQTEAWMSMQDASTAALATACEEKRRYTIVPLQRVRDGVGDARRHVGRRSAQETYDILAQLDVLVTNHSDKERQLPKILKLSETIKQAIERHAKRASSLQQIAQAVAARDASALTVALSLAERADLARANLRKGREALALAATACGDRQRVLDAFTEAQQVASEAFDRAQQLAKDTGVEDVTVKREWDGKPDSPDVHQVWFE